MMSSSAAVRARLSRSLKRLSFLCEQTIAVNREIHAPGSLQSVRIIFEMSPHYAFGCYKASQSHLMGSIGISMPSAGKLRKVNDSSDAWLHSLFFQSTQFDMTLPLGLDVGGAIAE